MSDSDSSKPDEHSRNLVREIEEIVDEDVEVIGDDQVEQAWESFKSKFLGRRGLVFGVFFIVIVLVMLYGVLPKLPGIERSVDQIAHRSNPWWIFGAFGLKVISYVSYIWYFRAIFDREAPLIGWRGSYHISMAGVAATRMIGAAGAGGVALTFWAVRKAGMGRRASVSYLVAFYVILYGIFMFALLLGGLLLRQHVLPGPAPFALTVIPALIGAIVILFFLAALLVPTNVERLAGHWASGRGKLATLAGKTAAVPALIGQGTRIAFKLVRERDVGLIGALGWWIFDLATLWACFQAFGYTVPFGALLMGYLFGWVANVIPTPGGVGAVDGGMIGAYVAFGVPVDIAVAAVLAYRIFAFFLPTIPGVISFLSLRKLTSEWQEKLGATIKSKATPEALAANE